VLSPGTGKNVITVGGLEQLRGLTNEVVIEGVTNAIWAGGTDSDYQVAGYSSRGNVGIGIEGEFGRFKPDVVAPGTFVASTRSTQWDEDAYYSITNTGVLQSFSGLTVAPGELAQFSMFVPEEVISLRITAFTTPAGTNAPLGLPIYVREGGTPTVADLVGVGVVSLPPDAPLVVPGNYYYAIGNPTNISLTFDVRVEVVFTNELEDYYRVLRQYRYETGTSMAAPGVSGVLALMQEYFEQRAGRTNSPAMMKALLINGARTVAPLYDLQVRSTVNFQGWGLADIRTSVPAHQHRGGHRACLVRSKPHEHAHHRPVPDAQCHPGQRRGYAALACDARLDRSARQSRRRPQTRQRPRPRRHQPRLRRSLFRQ
jgi:subtilisin family serine protease